MRNTTQCLTAGRVTMNQSGGDKSSHSVADMSQEDASPLQAAMSMADLIRKHVTQAEQQQLDDMSATTTTTTNKNDEPLSSFRFPKPPGFLEGVAAGILVLGVLTPVRSFLTKRLFFASSSSSLSARGNPAGSASSSTTSSSAQQQDSLGFLPDFLLTTTQMLLSFNAAMYVGSLYGSHHYLHQLASVSADPAVAPSRTADTICRDPLVANLLQRQDQGTLVLPTTTLTPTNNNINQNIVNSMKISSSTSMNPNQRVLIELQRALTTCRARNNSLQEESEN